MRRISLILILFFISAYLATSVSANVSTNTSSGIGTYYAPHQVKIFVRNGLGSPLEGVNVTATYVESSSPLDWLYSWLGMSTAVSPTNTTLSGTTGTDGAVIFIMMEMLKYHITVQKTGVIDTAVDIYPKDDTYTIYSSAFGESGQWYEHGYNPLEVVTFSAENAEINASYGIINVTYVDLLHNTTQAVIWINRTVISNGTEIFITNYTDTSGGNFTKSLYVVDQRGHSYMLRLNASHGTLGTVYRSGGFSFDSGPMQVGPIPESWHLPLAMICLLFTGMLIPLSRIGTGLLFLCFEGWVWAGVGWLHDAAPLPVIAAALTLSTVLAVAYMLVEKKREG